MMSRTGRSSSRKTRTVVIALGGLAVVASCRDAPTALEIRDGRPSLEVQVAALGIPASQLSQYHVAAGIADAATADYVTGIAYVLGQPEQVAIVTAPDGGFPTDGSSYLIVSSGDARDPRADGAWTWHPHPLSQPDGCFSCYPGSGDSVWVRLSVSLPASAIALELDYRFFTADDVQHIRTLPWWESVGITIVSSGGASIGWASGSPWYLARCGFGSQASRCTQGFEWFPETIQHLSMDVRAYAGQTVTLSALTYDYGQNNQRQTGVAIDGLRVVRGNLAPTANAGGPYVADEGISFALHGSASFDPEAGALTYAWALDADGVFDDATTAEFVHTFPDDGSYPVYLRVTDPEGASAIATTTVTVRNVAPRVSVDAASLVHPVRGHANVPLDIQFTDPGADTHSATIDCDNNAPPVSLTSVSSPFEYTCAYTTTFGERTIRVTVSDDDAGEGIATHTVSILYVWSGFFAPVDNAPAVNVAKAGSAIPIKFGLDGNQGLDVLASGSPGSRLAQCEGAPIGESVATHSPGASRLSYDVGAAQYQYVWKTERTWAGTCRQLIVRLADGTLHRTEFRFR